LNEFEKIRDIIAKTLGVSSDSVSLESTPASLPGWDSMRHIIMIMEIENALGLHFGMEEIPKLDSVQKIVLAANTRG
jgi:acyl carrier protein